MAARRSYDRKRILEAAARATARRRRHEAIRCYRRVLIAVEGLSTTEGDYPDLPEFIETKRSLSYRDMDNSFFFGSILDIFACYLRL